MYTKVMVQVQAKATRIEKGKKSSEGKKKKGRGFKAARLCFERRCADSYQ